MDFAIGRVSPLWTADVRLDSPLPVAGMQDIVTAVQAANRAEMFGNNSQLSFRFDRESQRAVIEIRDRTTKELLNQIPPENLLRVMDALLKHGRGNSLE
jgi:hypothetical protein